MAVDDPCTWLEPVREIAHAAGRSVLDIYEREYEVEEKDDHTPVTDADRRSHEIILARLQALTPEIPVLSEESTMVDFDKRAAWKQFWLVDPLDGTQEFINRNGEFTVNIALIDRHRPVLGVVYVPVPALTYFACAGQGAHRQKGGCDVETIRVRRYDSGKPIVVASRTHAGDATETFLKNIGPHDVVTMGSAMKFCLVAQGAADVYPRLGPTMEWDTAAAQCVVEAAGGRVTDLNRQPIGYNKPTLRNPSFLVSGAGDYDWCRHLSGL